MKILKYGILGMSLALFPAASMRLCASEIAYTLPEAENVTIVVEDAQGRRVRNLIADAPRDAGKNVETWDGYDDAGNPCAAGEYRWRGLTHGKIESRYAGSFYSPGDPPWRTVTRKVQWNFAPTGAGGWLSDHRPPLCAYAYGDDVFIGSLMAEAGHAMIRIDARTGRKTWGAMRICLGGASAFAMDGDILFIASEGGWMKDKFHIVRIDLKTNKIVPNPDGIAVKRGGANIHQQRQSAFVDEKMSDFSEIRGMAVMPEEILVSLADKGGRIVFFSRKTAEFTREIPLAGAGQLARAPDGAIWAVSAAGVANVKLWDCGNMQICKYENAPISPRGLAIDAEGNFYVSDVAANRCCVEVFSPDGSHLRTIGHPGGRHEGKFDPLAMGEPTSLCIDSQGNLWVAEHDFRPKRVSVWNAKTGELVRDYVGGPYYGGGGSVDAKGRFAYYDGMRFVLKPGLSGAEIDAVLFRPEEHPGVPYNTGKHNRAAPSAIREWRGSTFLVADSGYQSRPFIGEIDDDRLVPRVAVCDLVKTNASGKSKTVGAALWQNGETSECEGPRAAMMWASRIGPGMEILLRIPSPDNDWQTDALGILRPDDDLRYDFGRMQRLEMPDSLRGMIFSAAMTPDGRAVVVNVGRNKNRGENVIAAVSIADGRLLWTYPNPYPSNGHNSTLGTPGDIRHTCGFEGWAGDVFQLNGNKGTRYLFTGDGLFVAELFGDQRVAPSRTALLEAKRGMVLSTNSLESECFGGWLGTGPDGRVLQISGKDSCDICVVGGLEGMRRLDGGSFLLAEPPLKKSELPASEQGPLAVMQAGGFGFTRGWEDSVKRAFPEDNVATAALGVSYAGGPNPGYIHLWVKVKDASPWVGGGGDPVTPFKGGDCIDLRWAADPKANPKRRTPVEGDMRLIFAPDGKGGVTAFKYVFVDPSVAPDARRSFTSPTGTAYVDRIEAVPVKAKVEKTKDGYEFTADIPWKVLGEDAKPERGETRRADVGVLFGDSAGTETVRRVYLFDRESQIVCDLPNEVRVCPANWGNASF